MSNFGKRMKQRANRWMAEAASARTNQYPLRKVVSHTEDGREELECGHLMYPRSDMLGETNTVRRRCRKCEVKS